MAVCSEPPRIKTTEMTLSEYPSARTAYSRLLISLKKAIIPVSGRIGRLALSVTNGSSLQRHSMSLLFPTVHPSPRETEQLAPRRDVLSR